MTAPRLSALVVARNEEARLPACLDRLAFADEIVVVLDRTTDGSAAIARSRGARVIEGEWPLEGERRNSGIAACSGDWILEVDADEQVPPALAEEIRHTIATTRFDWHEIPVNNYIGARLIRHGWGGYNGKAAYPGLFRKGVKVWGREHVHPALTWSGTKGPMLSQPIDHFVDRDLSDLLRRLDSYSTAHARTLRDRGRIGTLAGAARRMVSRFLKCYVGRKGYREGGYGLVLAAFAALYPLLSYLKARDGDGR